MSAPKKQESRGEARGALRNERIEAALTKAITTGSMPDLFDQLSRNSGLPGPRPNLELARVLGQAIARHGGRGDAVLKALVASEDEYAKIVAAMALVARVLAGVDPKGSLDGLQELAEDARHGVRRGVVEALRVYVGARGEAAVNELGAWTDGYLQAHVALTALSDRPLLDALPHAEPVLARLDEAFALADVSGRAAERSQGVRSLRAGLPAQIVTIAARFPETIDWVEKAARAKRPETREVLDETIRALRKSGLSDADAQRLGAVLDAGAPVRRDADRVVHGTRQRSKGRR